MSSARFELQPTLEGALVRLRPLRPDDWAELFTVASDPLIWEQHPESDRYTEEVFRRYFQGALDSRGAFLVIDANDGCAIGSTRFNGYDENRSKLAGPFLTRAYWGGVYNREMKELMLRHAFRFVSSVIFRVGPRNFRSQRAVEKIGAQRDGTCVDGNDRESVRFRLTREEWSRIDSKSNE